MINVEHLNFTYPGNSSPSVKDLSFEVGQGEIFGFLGPSGAGKSTTQKILIRLLTGYTGEVNLLGKPLKQWSHDFYNHIGVGFELPNHYLKLTAWENLQFFASFYEVPVRPLPELFRLVGLEEHAQKRVEQYSKGMKMRLNFLRAIMHDPALLFLDEPTSGLDPANARLIKDIILRLKAEGKTIFITTHNMHDAEELCDRVAFMFDGRIVAMDTPEKLKQQAGEKAVWIRYRDGRGDIKRERFAMQRLGYNQDFLHALQAEEVLALETEENSLEKVFIQHTGKSLS